MIIGKILLIKPEALFGPPFPLGPNPGHQVTLRCPVSLVPSNLQWPLSVSLSFIILTLLKSAGQLFCRMVLNLALPDVSS